MDCDLVVLGAGGAGLGAGCRAFDLTGKKVVVPEKAPKPAGCTYFANRMGKSGPITDSKWQKDAGYEVNKDPQDLSGQFFDWLVTAAEGDAEKFFYVSKDKEMKGGMGGEGGIAIVDSDIVEAAESQQGGGAATSILEGKSSPCGGLGPALLSGFCTGTFAAKYLATL